MQVIAQTPTHKQVVIALKKTPIDVSMRAIIEWFNAFSEVNTISSCSCEGESAKPFLMWYSLDPVETIRILQLLSHNEVTTVHFSPQRGLITYVTRWPDIETINERMAYYLANTKIAE